MISAGGRQHQVIERLRAGLAEKRAVLDRTVADYQQSASAIVGRLQIETQQDQEHHDDSDYDAVDSWMSDQWSGAPEDARPSERDAVLDRIDSGELSWGEVLSGRVDDPETAAVRSFLDDRAADLRRLREARA